MPYFAGVKSIYIIAILLLTSLSLSAQRKAKEHIEKQPHFGKANCDNYKGYIPYHAELMPIKRVRLVLHIIQKDDGSGNLQNTLSEREHIHKILSYCNKVFQNADTIRIYPTGQIPIKDTRIRFEIDTILYHKDSKAYSFREECGVYDALKKDTLPDNILTFKYMDKLYNNFVDSNSRLSVQHKDSSLSLFFIEGGNWIGIGGAHKEFSKKWIYICGSLQTYIQGNFWRSGSALAKELGVALGLKAPHYRKDLPLSSLGYYNNFMDDWPGQWKGMTPWQMGTMHFGLAGKEGNISEALIRDECQYHPDAEMKILMGDTIYFDGDRRLQGDLTIEKGGVLIVKCQLSMPPNGTITIMPGGAFIIDGGLVYNACGQKWNGIMMEKRKPFLFFKRKSRSLFQVYNDGVFINTENGIMKMEMKGD